MNIERKFDGIAKKYVNLLPRFEEKLGHGYFWTVFECEYATDIMFNNRQDLENIFPSLVEKSFFTFKCNDIMSFFGRKLDWKFQGEVVSDARKRYQGFRIKHKMKSNQVKMYDKFSCLRIETTINDPHEFKVWKYKHNDETGEIIEGSGHWAPMGKSISNLYRYAEVSKATNLRYINALPMPVDINTPVKEIERISEGMEVNERHISGFNILNKDTTKIFEAIACSSKLLISRYINTLFYKQYNWFITSSVKRLNRANKLRNHGLIKKVNNSSKYYVTTNGRKIINSILLFKNIQLPESYSK